MTIAPTLRFVDFSTPLQQLRVWLEILGFFVVLVVAEQYGFFVSAFAVVGGSLLGSVVRVESWNVASGSSLLFKFFRQARPSTGTETV